MTRPHGDVGIVFQSAMLLPWRSVIGNVMMPVEVKKLPPQNLRSARTRFCTWSASQASSTNIPGSCPAACSSAPRSAGRSCTIPRSC